MRKIKEIIVPYSNLEIYLFGSILKKHSPNDIDLLVIYDDPSLIDEMIVFKRQLEKKFNEFFFIKLHISMATKFEIDEINFLKKINYYLKIEL